MNEHGYEFETRDIPVGKLNALVKTLRRQMRSQGKLARPEEVIRLIVSGEWAICPSPPNFQVEEDGVITLTVTTGSGSGRYWLNRLDEHGFCIGDVARQKILSPNIFWGAEEKYQVRIFKRSHLLFRGIETTWENLRSKAKEIDCESASVEVACALREMLNGRDIRLMDLNGVVVIDHDPARAMALCVEGDMSLGAYSIEEGRCMWGEKVAFAYVRRL